MKDTMNIHIMFISMNMNMNMNMNVNMENDDCHIYELSFAMNMITLWCHQTWLENPRNDLSFLARTITYKWSVFQHAMFDYITVHSLSTYYMMI